MTMLDAFTRSGKRDFSIEIANEGANKFIDLLCSESKPFENCIPLQKNSVDFREECLAKFEDK